MKEPLDISLIYNIFIHIFTSIYKFINLRKLKIHLHFYRRGICLLKGPFLYFYFIQRRRSSIERTPGIFIYFGYIYIIIGYIYTNLHFLQKRHSVVERTFKFVFIYSFTHSVSIEKDKKAYKKLSKKNTYQEKLKRITFTYLHIYTFRVD